MRNSEYWKLRFLQLESSANKSAVETLSFIDDQYKDAVKEIEYQISTWYARFAKNNEISIQEARKWLSASELKELKWDIKEYIKYGHENDLNAGWVKELENASAKFHISRLEALKLQTQMTCERLFGNQLDMVDSLLKNTYLDGYYHSAYEIQRGLNIGWDIASIDEKSLSKVMNRPWTTDGKNFSDRIWSNRSSLIAEVHKQLTQNLLLGRSPDASIKAISKKFNTSKNQAGRLVMTESAYFSSQSQKDSFNELGVEKFEVVETLDTTTCEICGSMDGQVFDMKDFEPGTTAPPFHPWCRGCTVPYFDDNFGEKAARGSDGKTYYVPSDMKFQDWKNSFVDNEEGSKDNLTVVKNDVTINMGTLSDESKLGQIHSDAMKQILTAAPENIQQIWNQYVDRLDVENAHSKRGAWCNYTKGITLDIEQVAKGERTVSRITHEWEQAKNPYYVAFHEFGHNISSWMANEMTGSAFGDVADTFQSKKFTRVITRLDGTSETLGYTLTGMLKKEGEEYFNSIFDNLKIEAKAKGLSARSVRKQDAWNIIQQEILEKPIINCTDISDMWDGISKGDCRPHYGHGKSYWKQITVGTEAFAEMFSATVMNPGSVAEIKHYFPNSYELFEEILNEMGVG